MAAKPLRIMYFTIGPRTAHNYGAALSLLDLVERLDSSRFTICSVVVQDEGALSAALRARGVPVSMTGLVPFSRDAPSRMALFLPSLLRAVAAAREADPHIIHANHLVLNQYAALAGRLLGVPTICHLRGRPRKVSYYAHLACLSDAIVANSKFTGLGWWSIPSARRKIRVVYNGIDTSRYRRAARRPTPVDSRLTDGHFVLGVVARISPEKGHDVLLRALPLALSRVPRIMVLLVGTHTRRTTRYAERIRQLTHNQRLSANVRFVGAVADPTPVYSQLDALVLPSRSESFGRVLVEAMAAGLPVIATESGGPSEIVVQGETGLLVPPGDHQALAQAICTLATRPDLCEAYGRAGRERACGLFDVRTHVSGIQTLYMELAARQTRRDADARESRWRC